MRLLKSLSLSSFSTGVRLAAAMMTFSIVARVLGPARFGQLMLCMSMASLLTIVSNFGLVTFLLREIGRQPAAASALFGRALSAKLLVTAVALLIGVAALPLLDRALLPPYLLLLLAMLVEGFTEFFNAGFRARQRFDVEARLALLAGFINAVGVGLVAWWSSSLALVAAAYLATRGIVALLTLHYLVQVVGPVRLAPWAEARRQLRVSLSYAIDSALTSAFGQVDSLVLNHFLGPVAVGVHQAGMRLFMAGTQAASVLANVFLPRAAAAHAAAPGEMCRESSRLQLAFLGVGAGFGLLLAIGGGVLVALMFGDSYQALVPLMPWFGLLFAAKFAAAAWGVVLTAQGLQSYRAAASAAHWVVIGVAAAALVPKLGNLGWLLALVVGSVFLCALYAVRAARRITVDATTLSLTALILLAFVPTLRWP